MKIIMLFSSALMGIEHYFTALALFFSTMILVMALGAQSLLVNNGKYLAAIANSLAISIGNLILFKLAPNATVPEMIGFVSGGPVGIFLAMYLLRHLHRTPIKSCGDCANNYDCKHDGNMQRCGKDPVRWEQSNNGDFRHKRGAA